MKTTTFATYLSKYFTVYLASESGCTPATTDSYRYCFILFLSFLEERLGITPERAEINHLTRENILLFLRWLEEKRGNGTCTRNQRQAAINSFVRYLIYEFPERLDEFQRILSIPVRKTAEKEISYLKAEGVKLLVDQIDLDTPNGLRDYVILSFLYTTGIRVSELIQIQVKDLSLYDPFTLLVHGKGQKSRFVPLMKSVIPYLKLYLKEQGLNRPEKVNEWLFRNHMHNQFTRQGINYLVNKYAVLARKINPNLIPKDLSPHKIRHSTAMGLVDSGVDLIYVRDLLGHVSVRTTEIYAKADAKKKREAIELASLEIVPPEEPQWEGNSGLMKWLMTFNKS